MTKVTNITNQRLSSQSLGLSWEPGETIDVDDDVAKTLSESLQIEPSATPESDDKKEVPPPAPPQPETPEATNATVEEAPAKQDDPVADAEAELAQAQADLTAAEANAHKEASA